MGTDFRAILRHNLSPQDLTLLPEKLNEYFVENQHTIVIPNYLESVPFSEVIENVRTGKWDQAVSSWQWKQWNDTSLDSDCFYASDSFLVGPTGHLLIHKHCIEFSPTCERWPDFVLEGRLQKALRQLSFHLSAIFASPFAIYVPDDVEPGCSALEMCYEGRSFEEICDYLKQTGKPAGSIVEMYDKKLYEEKGFIEAQGYFVDRFTDLLAVDSKNMRVAGLNRGQIKMREDFDEPLPDAFWLGEN